MEQPAAIPADIRIFLESILQEANVPSLDDEMKEGMIQELFYQFDNFLATKLVDSLKPEDLEILIKMNEEKRSKEEIETFMKEKLPNAQEVFSNAFVEFRNMYLEHTQMKRSERDTQ